jgi:enamine deaminase RidA (YjgF/YER057c/UK114 family)
MRFIDSRSDFPVSNAVIYSGHVFQAVLTGIPKGETKPVPGGAATEMREIFRQLDRTLSEVGIDRTQIVSVKLYLQDLSRDLKAVDRVYAEYFGSHSPNRGVYGVDLQPGTLIEAWFVATVPVYE